MKRKTNSIRKAPGKSKKSRQAALEFQKLVDIVAKLRGPNGCPWDKEQSQKSLAPYAIEEAYELAEAIEAGSSKDVQEELGDFLFQVILQAQVAEDEKKFNLKDVIQHLNQKMISRHPHVFANTQVKSVAEIWKNWEKIKNQEKPKPVFSYPFKLPALQAAHKIGVKTQGYRFDWDHPKEVMKKVKEEVKELEEALNRFIKKKGKTYQEHLEHEIGDVLFSVAQLSRHCKFESDQVLRKANRRFEKRFVKTLELSNLGKEEFSTLKSKEKEALWKKAKRITG